MRISIKGLYAMGWVIACLCIGYFIFEKRVEFFMMRRIQQIKDRQDYPYRCQKEIIGPHGFYCVMPCMTNESKIVDFQIGIGQSVAIIEPLELENGHDTRIEYIHVLFDSPRKNEYTLTPQWRIFEPPSVGNYADPLVRYEQSACFSLNQDGLHIQKTLIMQPLTHLKGIGITGEKGFDEKNMGYVFYIYVCDLKNGLGNEEMNRFISAPSLFIKNPSFIKGRVIRLHYKI